jgi:hypothetical protein
LIQDKAPFDPKIAIHCRTFEFFSRLLDGRRLADQKQGACVLWTVPGPLERFWKTQWSNIGPRASMPDGPAVRLLLVSADASERTFTMFGANSAKHTTIRPKFGSGQQAPSVIAQRLRYWVIPSDAAARTKLPASTAATRTWDSAQQPAIEGHRKPDRQSCFL